MKTMLIFLHIFFFIILFLLPFSNASSLACWATINTTVEPKAKFIGFHVVNNDLVAIYSNTLIKKWQLQTGFYISEHILNESHVLFNTQQLPETSKILMVYKDGAVELRDFEENYRIDAFLVTSIPFLKILPLPNTKFLYVLKETHLEKFTIAGENILSISQEKKKDQRFLMDLISIPNTDLLISSSKGNYLQIWNIKYDKYLKELKLVLSKDEELSCFVYYLPMDILLIGTNKGNIKFYNYNLGTFQFTMQAFDKEEVVHIHIFADYIAAISIKDKIKIFQGKKIIREIDLSLPQIIDFKMFFDPKGLLMGYAGTSTRIKTWRINYHNKDRCWDLCPKGTFPTEFECNTCPQKCEECQNGKICMKCIKGVYLDEGSCVKNCGFFKSEDEDGTCKQRMISFFNVFLASLLFITMEILRKFWKQIRSCIRNNIQKFFRRKWLDTPESETELIKKIKELESKLKYSDSYNQELSNLLKHRSSENCDNTQNVIKLECQNLSFGDYSVLIPYEEISYPKTKDSRIGKGGFSTVYKADLFGSTWAVKKFSWNFSGVSALDFKDIQSVVNEILIMNSLHHERILKLKACGFRIKQKKFSVKIVTEIMKCDLKQLIYSDHELTDEEKLNIALQTLYGIRYLHSRRIQHLDLKPQNILVNADHSEIKIADFGISKANFQETKKTAIIGTTLVYSSREYAIENKVSPQKSDMWSYGAILFELFAKRRPWGEWGNEEVKEFLINKEDFLEKSNGNLPKEIKEIITLCMKHNTEERISSEELLKVFPRDIHGIYLKTIKSGIN